MEFKINKNSEFPIYQQLKEQVKFYLLSGVLQPGTKIPTPKDLGAYLQINRNTVIAAYKELEQEGLLMSKCGQGTYITENLPISPQEERKQALIALAQESIDKAKELGFNPEDLFTVIYNKTVLGLDSPLNASTKQEFRALMIECNLPDLLHYQRSLQTMLGIAVEKCLLEELPSRISTDLVQKADFVVTNITHLEEVKALFDPYHKDVFGVMAAPQLQVLMEIMKLPAGTRVGLTCITDELAARIERTIIEAGIDHLVLCHNGTEDIATFKEMLEKIDYLISSRAVIDTIRPLVPERIKIIEYTLEIDQAMLEMLTRYLAQKQKKPN